MTYPTEDQLELMTVKALTDLYNSMAPALGNYKPIKKFETKAQGIKRMVLVIAAAKSVAAKAVSKKTPKEKAPTGDKPAKVTVSSRCKQLILEGLTNAEVWKIVQQEFNLSDDKKYYPAWNRSALNRKGS